MRAILIDPTTQTVKAFDFTGDYTAIQKAIDVDCFTCIRPFETNDDTLFLDDEGLFKDNPAYFQLDSYPQPLSGKGLILGSNGEDNGDCVTTVDEVIAQLTWVKTMFRGSVSGQHEIDHPILGATTVFSNTPVFDHPTNIRASSDNIAK
jgi:hypothetical protein